MNGVKFPPTPLRWLLLKNAASEPLFATIKFQLVDQTVADWVNNGKNLRELLPNPYIYLDDSSYSGAK